MAVAGLNHGG